METSAYTPSPYPGMPITMPTPPRLHWGWVLLLTLLTRGFFGDIWLLVQAIWIRKVAGRNDLQRWAIVNVCKIPVGILIGAATGAASAHAGLTLNQSRGAIGLTAGMYGLVVAVIYLVTIFRMRTALEEPPIGIPLGGVMTFFFGTLYFQYFLRDWVPMTYGTAAPYAQYTYPSVPPQA